MRYGRPRARRRVMSSPRAAVRRPARPTVRRRPVKRRRNPGRGGQVTLTAGQAKAFEKKWKAEMAKKRSASKKRAKRTTAKKKPAKRKTYAKKRTAKRKKTRKTATARKTARKTTRSRASYKKAARKAARTRKSNAAKRSTAAKKAARTRKRGKKTTARKTVKRKTARKTTKRRRGKLTKAQRSAAARKGWRKKRRSKMARPVSRKRRTYRKKARSRRKFKTRAKKPLGSFRGKRRYVRSGRKRGGKWARHPKRTYTPVGRHKRRTARAAAHRERYWVRKNPLNALKSMVKDGIFTFAGILGIRALSKLLEKNVFSSSTFQTGAMASVAPLLAPGLAMLLAALAPKVITNQPKLVAGLQTGATLVMFDSVLKVLLNQVDPNNTFSEYLLPAAPTTTLLTTTTAAASQGWGGYREYVGSPMGLEVESAMALDEYVSSPQLGMGGDYDVEEALAGNETQAFETGYAGGTLAKTVFSNY